MLWLLLQMALPPLSGCGQSHNDVVDGSHSDTDTAPPDAGVLFDRVATPEDSATLKWTFVPAGEESVVTGLAAVDGYVYFVARDLERYSLYSVGANGDLAWRSPLPFGNADRIAPIIASNGDILLFGNELSNLRYKGSWVHRFSGTGEHLWTRAHLKQMPSNFDQHGIKSAAPAIDDSGNVYFVLEDELLSVDINGERRWAVSAAADFYGCGLDGGTGWSPIIAGERVFLLGKGGEFISVTLDGETVYRSKLDHCPERWPVLRRDGAILMANSGYVASYDQQGSRTYVWPGLSDDDIPVVFSGTHMFVARTDRVTKHDGTRIAWSTTSLTSSPLNGVVAGERDTWFLATSPLPNITVISEDGQVTFSRNPGFWPSPEWDSAVVADGALAFIATARDSEGRARNGLVCVLAPVQVPPTTGWRTRNADHRNQRRLN